MKSMRTLTIDIMWDADCRTHKNWTCEGISSPIFGKPDSVITFENQKEWQTVRVHEYGRKSSQDYLRSVARAVFDEWFARKERAKSPLAVEPQKKSVGVVAWRK